MASRISSEISYYLASVYYKAKTFFIYRAQAWLWVVQSVLSLFFSLIAITVIYTVSSGVAGWSYWQLMFLIYLTALTFGVVEFVSNPMHIPYALRQGQIDSYMTRPFGVLTIMFANNIQVYALVSSIGGSIAFLAYASLHLQLSLLLFAAFLPLYLLGVAAFVMFLQMLGVLSYKLMKSGSFIGAATNALTELSEFPLSIYGSAAQLFFTLLVPIGVAAYYPLQVLLGNVTPAVYVAMLALSAFFLYAFYWLFNRLMRSYESGGG